MIPDITIEVEETIGNHIILRVVKSWNTEIDSGSEKIEARIDLETAEALVALLQDKISAAEAKAEALKNLNNTFPVSLRV